MAEGDAAADGSAESKKSPYGLPLPSVSHQVISEEELGDRNLLVVGDVHGCYDELVELLDACNGRDPNVCLVFVGDLMNKGPESAEVVKLVRELGAYSVRGNHDEVSLSMHAQYSTLAPPLQREFQWLHQLSEEDLEWAHSLPYTITIPSKKIIVAHAGLVPGVDLVEQDPNLLLHIRNVWKDKDSKWVGTKTAVEGSVPWGSVWTGPEVVYFGHDARKGFQSHPYAIGLDTGCVYGGKLTGVFPFEENRLVQVTAHTIHRSTEKGKGKPHDDTSAVSNGRDDASR